MRDVIYNGIRLNDYLLIKDVKESILPGLNNISLKLGNYVGSKFIRQEMEERIISIDAIFIKDDLEDRQELIDRLAPLLYSKGEKDLILDNNRKYKAALNGATNIDNVMYDGIFTMTFIAHDPIAYGNDVILNFNSNDELMNNGNYKARGSIELIARSTKLSARLTDGNMYDYVSVSNLSSGDKVVIDLIDENVSVNGESKLIDMDPLGDFFDIPSGPFSITLDGASSGTIKFTERWI